MLRVMKRVMLRVMLRVMPRVMLGVTLRAQLTSQLLLGGLRQQEGHAVHQGGPSPRAVPLPLELRLPTASSCDCTHSTSVSCDQCLQHKQTTEWYHGAI